MSEKTTPEPQAPGGTTPAPQTPGGTTKEGKEKRWTRRLYFGKQLCTYLFNI